MSKLGFSSWFWFITFSLSLLHWKVFFLGLTSLGAFILFMWGLFMLLEFKLEEFENEMWKYEVFS